jgi:hypothetical protein
MIIFLTERNKIHLCRLSHWPRIGSVCGPSYNQRTSASEVDFGCNRLELVARDLYNQSISILILDWIIDDVQAPYIFVFAF